MAEVQLYFRTKFTKGVWQQVNASQTRTYTDEYNNVWSDANISANGWVNARTVYGMSLEDGAISKILTPAPHKVPVTAVSATTHGKAMLGDSIGKVDGRTLSFDVHFTASNEAEFMERYYNFGQQIIGCGFVQMRTVLPGGKMFPVYRHRELVNNNYVIREDMRAMNLVYQGCQPFQQFGMGLAKFTLSFEEPHPEITTIDNNGINI